MNKKSGGGSAAPNAYKALSILLALILLAAAVVELVLWRLDYIVFQNPNAEQAQEEADLNDNLVMTPQNGKLMRLSVTRAAAADGGYAPVTLSATVLPETATDKSVDWSVAFIDAESDWATGKTVTDYVTVTPASDGAATATVQCLEDFGEQIVVTATSRDNPEAAAQCTVDFVKRISGMTFTPSDLVVPTSGYEFDVQYTDYTLDSEVTVTVSNYMKLTDGFKNAITTKFSQLTTKYRFNTDWWFSSSGAMIKGDLEAGTLTFSGIPKTPAGCFTYPDDEYDSDQISEMCGYIDSAFRSAVSSYSDVQATFDVTYTVRYGEETYMSGTKTVECRFDYASLTVPVGSLSLNKENIQF